MRAREFLPEYKVNNDIMNGGGLGVTGYNADVNYHGIRVNMRPSTFLSLAAPLDTPRSVDYIVSHLESGGALGSPYLTIHLPDGWFNNDYSDPASVIGHEGRNRMLAIQKVHGDDSCEVHLFLRTANRKLRASHITPEIIDKLQQGIYREDTENLINDPIPLFTVLK